jgi:hypothetical protein
MYGSACDLFTELRGRVVKTSASYSGGLSSNLGPETDCPGWGFTWLNYTNVCDLHTAALLSVLRYLSESWIFLCCLPAETMRSCWLHSYVLTWQRLSLSDPHILGHIWATSVSFWPVSSCKKSSIIFGSVITQTVRVDWLASVVPTSEGDIINFRKLGSTNLSFHGAMFVASFTKILPSIKRLSGHTDKVIKQVCLLLLNVRSW